ncbi:unnamed protein product [Meloidogyne enterolobii]|uniref:Uncharacterized protein n=1 Tax=Meloidogyne enterolobii TaxID=390850 RepID=A0ACB0XT62_MELEN
MLFNVISILFLLCLDAIPGIRLKALSHFPSFVSIVKFILSPSSHLGHSKISKILSSTGVA